MFLLLSTYYWPLDVMDELLPAHQEYLDRYLAEGVFLMWARRVPRTGGVILAHGVNRDRIEVIAGEDPFARTGAATYEVVEIAPMGGVPELLALL
jgi:uncharacterized protein YciI